MQNYKNFFFSSDILLRQQLLAKIQLEISSFENASGSLPSSFSSRYCNVSNIDYALHNKNKYSNAPFLNIFVLVEKQKLKEHTNKTTKEENVLLGEERNKQTKCEEKHGNNISWMSRDTEVRNIQNNIIFYGKFNSNYLEKLTKKSGKVIYFEKFIISFIQLIFFSNKKNKNLFFGGDEETIDASESNNEETSSDDEDQEFLFLQFITEKELDKLRENENLDINANKINLAEEKKMYLILTDKRKNLYIHLPLALHNVDYYSNIVHFPQNESIKIHECLSSNELGYAYKSKIENLSKIISEIKIKNDILEKSISRKSEETKYLKHEIINLQLLRENEKEENENEKKNLLGEICFLKNKIKNFQCRDSNTGNSQRKNFLSSTVSFSNKSKCSTPKSNLYGSIEERGRGRVELGKTERELRRELINGEESELNKQKNFRRNSLPPFYLNSARDALTSRSVKMASSKIRVLSTPRSYQSKENKDFISLNKQNVSNMSKNNLSLNFLSKAKNSSFCATIPVSSLSIFKRIQSKNKTHEDVSGKKDLNKTKLLNNSTNFICKLSQYNIGEVCGGAEDESHEKKHFQFGNTSVKKKSNYINLGNKIEEIQKDKTSRNFTSSTEGSIKKSLSACTLPSHITLEKKEEKQRQSNKKKENENFSFKKSRILALEMKKHRGERDVEDVKTQVGSIVTQNNENYFYDNEDYTCHSNNNNFNKKRDDSKSSMKYIHFTNASRTTVSPRFTSAKNFRAKNNNCEIMNNNQTKTQKFQREESKVQKQDEERDEEQEGKEKQEKKKENFDEKETQKENNLNGCFSCKQNFDMPSKFSSTSFAPNCSSSFSPSSFQRSSVAYPYSFSINRSANPSSFVPLQSSFSSSGSSSFPPSCSSPFSSSGSSPFSSSGSSPFSSSGSSPFPPSCSPFYSSCSSSCSSSIPPSCFFSTEEQCKMYEQKNSVQMEMNKNNNSFLNNNNNDNIQSMKCFSSQASLFSKNRIFDKNNSNDNNFNENDFNINNYNNILNKLHSDIEEKKEYDMCFLPKDDSSFQKNLFSKNNNLLSSFSSSLNTSIGSLKSTVSAHALSPPFFSNFSNTQMQHNYVSDEDTIQNKYENNSFSFSNNDSYSEIFKVMSSDKNHNLSCNSNNSLHMNLNKLNNTSETLLNNNRNSLSKEKYKLNFLANNNSNNNNNNTNNDNNSMFYNYKNVQNMCSDKSALYNYSDMHSFSNNYFEDFPKDIKKNSYEKYNFKRSMKKKKTDAYISSSTSSSLNTSDDDEEKEKFYKNKINKNNNDRKKRNSNSNMSNMDDILSEYSDINEKLNALQNYLKSTKQLFK